MKERIQEIGTSTSLKINEFKLLNLSIGKLNLSQFAADIRSKLGRAEFNQKVEDGLPP